MSGIVLILASIVLPIALGYFFSFVKLFDEQEISTLRKFVVKVGVPFLIFKNLYQANMKSLGQFFPSVFAFILLTILFTSTAYFISRNISGTPRERNAFAFSIFAGNYGFLGWGVVYSFYGENALTRSMFFTTFFWPVFLLAGFWCHEHFLFSFS